MTPEVPEILPDETKNVPPSSPEQTEKILVQPKFGAPVMPKEVWDKLSKEEQEKFGEDAWREQK